MTIEAVLGLVKQVYTMILSFFSNIIDMIVDNPLVFTPVLLAFMGGIVMFVFGMIHKFKVRGIASAGGRRRRRG